MQIWIHDKSMRKVCALNNNIPGMLPYSNSQWHTYLEYSTSTLDFTIPKIVNGKLHEDIKYINDQMYVSFYYDNSYHVFYVSQLIENDFNFQVTCNNTNLELAAEISRPLTSVDGAKTLEWYLQNLDLLGFAGLEIGINEVSDKTRTITFESQSGTKLEQLHSLMNQFDAEFVFRTDLNRDGTLKKFVIDIYNRPDENHHGIGKVRGDVTLYYQTGLKGVQVSSDKTQLFNAGYFVGKDGLTLGSVVFEEKNELGQVEFYSFKDSPMVYAPLSADKYPSALGGANEIDRWTRRDFQTEYSDVDSLKAYALRTIKQYAYPLMTYTVSVQSSFIENYKDINLGDAIKIVNNNFRGGLALEARVSEMIISFDMPQNNSVVFTNFRKLDNKPSSELQQRIDEIVSKSLPYRVEIRTTNGTVFKNGIGRSTVKPILKQGDKIVDATYRFVIDGTIKYSGMTYDMVASEITQPTTLTVAAWVDDKEVASEEVTFLNISDGKQGPKGADGKTPYFHTAWAYSADGKDRFTKVYPNLNLLDGTDNHTVTGTGKWTEGNLSNKTIDDMLTLFKGLEGQTVTVSVDYKYSGFVAGSGNNRLGWEIQINTDKASWFGAWYYPSNGSGSGRVSSTFVVPKNIISIEENNGYIQFSGSGTGTLSRLKIEKGDKVTPWMPSANEVTTADYPKYIGHYSNYTQADSPNPQDYTWSLIRGEDGKQGPQGPQGIQGPKGDQGIPGPKGADGKTQYTHIAYANSSDGTRDFSTSDSNREYIGMYVDFKIDDSTNPSDYSWTLVKGADGTQGTPGKPGADGKTPYFHTAWAYSADGKDRFTKVYPNLNLLDGTDNHTVTGTGKWTEGNLSNKTIDDMLTLFKGLEGQTVTVSVDYKYSGFVAGSGNNRLGWEIQINTDKASWFGAWYYPSNGSGSGRVSSTFVVPKNIISIEENNGYIQFSGSGTGTLSRLKIEKGDKVTPWMPSANEVTTADYPKYIGHYSNYTQADSPNPQDYTWSLIRGEDGKQGPQGPQGIQGPKGDQGIPGPKGADGKTQYTHIAYADTVSGSGFSQTDVSKAYIGMYQDFNATDSQNPQDYRWSKWKGSDGKDGIPGPKGEDGRTPYVHFAYADSADGRTGFSTTQDGSKRYLGVCTNFNKEDSTNPDDYTWSDTAGSISVGGRNLLNGSKGPFKPDSKPTNFDNIGFYKNETSVYLEQGKNYIVSAKTDGNFTSNHNPDSDSDNVVLWLFRPWDLWEIVSDSKTGTTGTQFTWDHPTGTYHLRVNTYHKEAIKSAWEVKIEEGTVKTDWTPSVDDVQNEIDTKADDVLTQAQLNKLNEVNSIMKAELDAKASLDTLDQWKQAYQNFVNASNANRAQAEKALADASARVAKLENNLKDMSERWNFIDSYMSASNEGLVVGKTDNSSSMLFSPSGRISMFSAGHEVMYISQGVIHIENGIFSKTIQIGRYREEQDVIDPDRNVIRYVGGA